MLVDAVKRFNSVTFPQTVGEISAEAEHSRQARKQVLPFKHRTRYSDITHDTAYQVAAACCAARCRDDKIVPVGRKIGFTNKNIWPDYNIDASIWSYVYSDTVSIVRTGQTVDISRSRGLEPRIEPEIVFGIKKTPSTGMSEEELLECIQWVAHGFEVVHSIYPSWRFTATDTIIGFGLHGQLLIGERHELSSTVADGGLTAWTTKLQDLHVDLLCNGKTVDSGRGINVLGSPLRALQHLVELLDKQTLHPRLQPGEVVTTGTLTQALPISHGDRWQTKIGGIGLSDLDITFGLTAPALGITASKL